MSTAAVAAATATAAAVRRGSTAGSTAVAAAGPWRKSGEVSGGGPLEGVPGAGTLPAGDVFRVGEFAFEADGEEDGHSTGGVAAGEQG